MVRVRGFYFFAIALLAACSDEKIPHEVSFHKIIAKPELFIDQRFSTRGYLGGESESAEFSWLSIYPDKQRALFDDFSSSFQLSHQNPISFEDILTNCGSNLVKLTATFSKNTGGMGYEFTNIERIITYKIDDVGGQIKTNICWEEK